MNRKKHVKITPDKIRVQRIERIKSARANSFQKLIFQVAGRDKKRGYLNASF